MSAGTSCTVTLVSAESPSQSRLRTAFLEAQVTFGRLQAASLEVLQSGTDEERATLRDALLRIAVRIRFVLREMGDDDAAT